MLRNEKYNAMQEKGMSQGKMKALLHNQVITSVLEKLDGKQPEAILIDQFAEPGIYFKHLAGKKLFGNGRTLAQKQKAFICQLLPHPLLQGTLFN